MIKNIFIALVAFIVFTLSGCDEIEKPYLRDDDGGGGGQTTEVVRKVMIEDFTGHTCVNCPEAHQIADELKQEFGDSLIVIAIHAGNFAVPVSAPYTADYRTAVGTELNNAFEVPGYPSGMINRKDNAKLYLSSSWKQEVRSMMGLSAIATIDLTPVYGEGSTLLGADIDIEFSEVPEGQVNICVYVTESGIISAQKNNNESVGPTPDITGYEHNHMLRGSLTGTWGEPVAEDALVSETVYSKSFTGFTIDSGWNVENMSLVAFIYNQTTSEIIQAEKAHVLE